MLTMNQKMELRKLSESGSANQRVLRKRVLDKSVKCVDDLIFTFRHSDHIPDLKRRIPPEKMDELIHSYFEAFKVSPDFSDPERVIRLLDEIAVLQRKNAALAQEMGDLIHRIEHFKYVASHSTQLLEMERAKTDGIEIVAKM